eukprot:TRINITY_DN14194_c0_g1_i1.p1 TRINITY_DN14194_c0_g1~~TRINITY_DN14194_c0_g1_i1.p1  ORF type:complete len:484 (-),score=112.92 TRINITY_DN14194_c0_g1_i1:659-2110(-)
MADEVPAVDASLVSDASQRSGVYKYTADDINEFADNPTMLQAELENLKVRLREAEDEQRFRDASVINNNLETLKGAVIKHKKQKLFAEYNHVREQCEQQRIEEMEQTIAEWEAKDLAIQQELDGAIVMLQSAHAAEREELAERLQRQLQPHGFKPSKKLIEAQRKLTSLVQLKMYEEAEECKGDIAAFDKKERLEYEKRIHAEYASKQDRLHMLQVQQCKHVAARNQMAINRHETAKARAFKDLHTRYENQLQLLEEQHNISQHKVEQQFNAPQLAASVQRGRQTPVLRPGSRGPTTPSVQRVAPSPIARNTVFTQPARPQPASAVSRTPTASRSRSTPHEQPAGRLASTTPKRTTPAAATVSSTGQFTREYYQPAKTASAVSASLASKRARSPGPVVSRAKTPTRSTGGVSAVSSQSQSQPRQSRPITPSASTKSPMTRVQAQPRFESTDSDVASFVASVLEKAKSDLQAQESDKAAEEAEA